ncbi:MAG TPA: PIG-L family deacetylase [Thermomicrobiales bacterium]|nr:PIG-L family deacetylase [Thermomicrobiales bacterium]
MTTQSILAIYAHPDDESQCAGTLANLAADGALVTLVCATRGEVGEISDPALATPETLAHVREGELRCAAQAMGIGEPIFLDYRDSGMDGTPENEHPDAFMNAEADEVAGRLVQIIRDVRPQVVVTFDETGGYGHPDHIAIWRHTHAAVAAAADAARFPEAGEPWQVERIAYAVFPRSFFTGMRQKLVELAEDTSDLDRFLELGIGFADERINAITDVSGFIEQKFAAIDCHKTQFGGDSFFSRVGDDEMRRMMSREYFVFGWPEPESSELLSELFP